MKQGNNFSLPVQIGMDLDLVERIEFVFRQGNTTKYFEYPSEHAYLCPELKDKNVIDIVWSSDDTWPFNARRPLYLDSRIHLIDCDENPETVPVEVTMHATCFEKGGGE